MPSNIDTVRSLLVVVASATAVSVVLGCGAFSGDQEPSRLTDLALTTALSEMLPGCDAGTTEATVPRDGVRLTGIDCVGANGALSATEGPPSIMRVTLGDEDEAKEAATNIVALTRAIDGFSSVEFTGPNFYGRTLRDGDSFIFWADAFSGSAGDEYLEIVRRSCDCGETEKLGSELRNGVDLDDFESRVEDVFADRGLRLTGCERKDEESREDVGPWNCRAERENGARVRSVVLIEGEGTYYSGSNSVRPYFRLCCVRGRSSQGPLHDLLSALGLGG